MVRPGHSLVELLIALSFLGTTLLAVGASAIVGARWAAEGGERQHAIREAVALLDSLSAVEAPVSGERPGAGLVLRWAVEPVEGGHDIRVVALGPIGTALVTIETATARPLQELPAADTANGAGAP